MKRLTSLFIITTLLSACSALPDSTATHSTTQATADVAHGSSDDTAHHLTHLSQEWRLTAVQGVDYQGRPVATLDLTDPAKPVGMQGVTP